MTVNLIGSEYIDGYTRQEADTHCRVIANNAISGVSKGSQCALYSFQMCGYCDQMIVTQLDTLFHQKPDIQKKNDKGKVFCHPPGCCNLI